ncbi:MAG: glycosyltransferase [Sarcina sp.]
MKKIIIVNDSLRVGGIQSSLVNLINNIDYTKYDVELFLFNETIEYKFNNNIKILVARGPLKYISMSSKECKKKNFFFWGLRKLLAVACSLFGSNSIFKMLFFFEKNLENYDLAISYSNNVSSNSLYFGYNKFVLEKIKAKEKVAWIHVNYKDYNLNNRINNAEYKKFNKVINVSEDMSKIFDSLNIISREKSLVIENLLPIKEIIAKSEEFNIKFDKFTVVTVSRLDKLKQIDKLIKIIFNLKSQGYSMNFYIIGDGPERKSLERLILKYNLNESVFFTGYLSNPYPYIKNSNLYVSASKTESFGLSIAESVILQTPVIAYDCGCFSKIINSKNGILVEKLEYIETYIKLILNEKNLNSLFEFDEYLSTKNRCILKKIEILFEGENDV